MLTFLNAFTVILFILQCPVSLRFEPKKKNFYLKIVSKLALSPETQNDLRSELNMCFSKSILFV